MKPQKLDIHFFGPYRDQHVDFTVFKDFPVFLISGKTGAGKTTLFDAMCFALFGETSGKERDGKQMRADFATMTDETSVSFTFTHERKTYVIERKPDQLIAKKNGSGVTDRPAKVELTVFKDGEELNQLTKINTVNDYIRNLLQLSASQFKQIILIPQGKFREFLTASSGDKEVILRDLFGTELFENWAEELKNLLADKKTANADIEQQLGTYQSQLKWTDENKQQAQESQLPTDVLKLMAEQQTTSQTNLVQQRAAVKAAEAKVTGLQKELTEGQKLTEQIQQLAQLAEAQTKLDAQSAHINEVKAQIEDLRWAQSLRGHAENWQQGREELVALRSQLTRSQEKQQQTAEFLKKAQQDQANLTVRQPEMDAVTKQIGQLEAVRDHYDSLAKTETELAQAKVDLTSFTSQKATLNEKLVTEQTQLTALETAIGKESGLLKQQADLKLKQQQLINLKHRIEVRDGLEAKLQMTLEQVGSAKAAVTLSQTQNDERKTQYDTINQKWLAEEISRLSAQLTPGAPCPVCGSTDHPVPAPTATIDVSEVQVKNAKAEFDESTRQLGLRQQEWQALEATAKEQRQQLNDAAIALNDQNKSNTTDKAQVGEEISQVESDQTVLKTELGKISKSKETSITSKSLLTELQSQLDSCDQQLNDANLRQAQLQTRKIELTKQLPADLVTVDAYQTKLSELRTSRTQFDTDLKAANATVEKQQVALTQLAADVKNVTSQLEKQEKTNASLEQELKAATVEKLHSDDIGLLLQLIQELDDLATLKAEVDHFSEKQSEIKGQIRQAKEAVGNQKQPDLALLTKQLAAIKETSEGAQQAYYHLEQMIEANQELVEKMQALMNQQRTQLEQLNKLAELSEVVNGNGSQRLSLERYVLQTYLQRVLFTANARLTSLTNGRYRFELATEPESGRGKTGLGINIYDDNVGKQRSVNTLSGGESFIAALALALGLAEVIQNQSGGIKIEALFIDEGFGSLDEDALERAMETLQSMESNSRMIGIISHVKELQDQIPGQLMVTPSGNGESTVSYQTEF